MVTCGADAVFRGASCHLNSGLRAGGARAWSSNFSVMSFLRMLHVFALNVLKFNLAILNTIAHMLIQLIKTFVISLLIIRFCTFFNLVVVYHMWIYGRLILLN